MSYKSLGLLFPLYPGYLFSDYRNYSPKILRSTLLDICHYSKLVHYEQRNLYLKITLYENQDRIQIVSIYRYIKENVKDYTEAMQYVKHNLQTTFPFLKIIYLKRFVWLSILRQL